MNPARPTVMGGYGSITGILVETETKKPKKRLASPDLWELSRLEGGQVKDLVDEMKQNAYNSDEMNEETQEIELNEEEAPFLEG